MNLIFSVGLLFLISFGISRLLNYFKSGKPNRALPWVSILNFPIRIPYLDSFYTLYKFRSEGLQLVSEWAPKFRQHSVIRINPWPFQLLAVTDASLCQKILSSSNPSYLNKPQTYYSHVFVGWLKEGLLNADYGTWMGHRKALNKAFTFNALQTYLKIFNRNSKGLVRSQLLPLSSQTKNGEWEVEGKEIHEAFDSFAMETILDIIMGTDYDIEKEAKQDFLMNYNTFRNINNYRLYHPELRPNFIWRLHPKSREHERATKATHEFVMKVIALHMNKRTANGQINDVQSTGEIVEDESKKVGSGEICLIDFMLSSGFSREEIYQEVGTFLFAVTMTTQGHETTENAVHFLLFDLALNPEHQNMCRSEVDKIFDAEQLDCDLDLNITMDHLSNLKYLERCIMESMRLTPSVPIIARVMNSPLRLNENVTLDTGENVVIPIWVLHRDPRNYPNPEKFDPARFLPDEVKKRIPGAYIPFSFGRRICIGWKFAMLQMKTEMAWLLRHFTFHTTDKPSNVKLHFNMLTKPERHYNIILRRRKQLN